MNIQTLLLLAVVGFLAFMLFQEKKADAAETSTGPPVTPGPAQPTLDVAAIANLLKGEFPEPPEPTNDMDDGGTITVPGGKEIGIDTLQARLSQLV